MRKVIVLVCLAAVMMLCVCGAANAAECPHWVNTLNRVYDTEYPRYTYTSIDDSSHQTIVEYWNVAYCKECGYIDDEEWVRNDTPIIEPHRFETQDGIQVCADCGYGKILPAPQISTNLTGTAGNYSIAMGTALEITLAETDDYAEKGEVWLHAVLLGENRYGSQETVFDTAVPVTGDEGTNTVSIDTDRLMPQSLVYTLQISMWDHTGEWGAYALDDIQFTVSAGLETGEILICLSEDSVLTNEWFTIGAVAPGANRIELWDYYSENDEDLQSEADQSYITEQRCISGSGLFTYRAKAYYPDREPVISNTVTVSINAPYGNLQNALQAQMPLFAAPNGAVSITLATIDPEAAEDVIPDDMGVYLPNGNQGNVYEANANDTNTLTIPQQKNGEPILEAGKCYQVNIWANKLGWDNFYVRKLLIIQDGEDEECTLRINGEHTEKELVTGEYYSLTFSGLPEGATAVSILNADRTTWDSYPITGTTGTYTTPEYAITMPMTDAAIYGRYTTDEITDQTDYAQLNWTYTNPVTVSVDDSIYYDPLSVWAVNDNTYVFCEYGEAITLAVEASNGIYNAEFDYAWTEQWTDTEGVVQTNTLLQGTNEAQLTFIPQNNHNIICTVTDRFGQYASIDFTIDVKAPIIFDFDYHDENSNITVNEGSDAVLAVQAETVEGLALTYEWEYRVTDENANMSEWIPLEGTGNSITIENITRHLKVRCTISNGFKTQEAWFFIYVNNGLTADYTTETFVSVDEGGSVTFGAEGTTGKGTVHYRWSWNGYDPEYGYISRDIENATEPSLTISNVSAADIGRYYCEIYTEYQCTNCMFDINHVWGEVSPSGEPETEYEWYSTAQHRKITREKTYRHCVGADCNETLEEEVETTEPVYEDHTTGAVCTTCGKEAAGNHVVYEYGNNGDVIISGYGVITAREDWATDQSIQRIRITGNELAIGSGAFAGFDHEIRVDFLGARLPMIEAGAFTGTTAVCRYYTEDESWTNAGTYGGNLTWMYLPVYVDNDKNSYLVFNNGRWSLMYDKDADWAYAQMTMEQAMETAFRSRGIRLFQIPGTAELRAPYEQHWDKAFGIYFLGHCAAPTGEDPYVINLPEGLNQSFILEIQSQEMNLTAYTADPISSVMIYGHGQHTIYGDVNTLTVKRSDSTGSVTVDGDVDGLVFHGASEGGEAYMGTLSVTGTIGHGDGYGTGKVYIPRIGEKTADGEETDLEVSIENVICCEFDNVQMNTPIAQNGQILVPGATETPAYSKDNCYLHYQWENETWSLSFEPRELKAGSGDQGRISDLREYKEDFSLADMQWGPYSTLWIMYQGQDGSPVALNGDNGAGLRCLSVYNSRVEINCPLTQLDVYDYQNDGASDSEVIINDEVGMLQLDSRNSGRFLISTGTNGSVEDGRWLRNIYGDRFFGTVSSGQEGFYANGHLSVMSWMEGQQTKAIMPTESVLRTAAGLDENHQPIMNVSDSYERLTEDELAALETLTESKDWEGTEELDRVYSMFNIEITDYDADNGGYSLITELDEDVQITVNNPSESSVRIARLHYNDDGSVTADAVSEGTSGETVDVTSDKFSRFVVMSDTTQPKGLNGYETYTWYTAADMNRPAGSGAYSLKTTEAFFIPGEDYDEDAAAPVWSLEYQEGPDCFRLVNYEDSRYYAYIAPQEGGIDPDVTGTAKYRISADYRDTIYFMDIEIRVDNTDVSTLDADVSIAPFDPDTPAIGEWQAAGDLIELTYGVKYAVRLQPTGAEGVGEGAWYDNTGWYDTVYSLDRWNYTYPDGNDVFQKNESCIDTNYPGMTIIEGMLHLSASNLCIRKPMVVRVTAPYGRLEDALSINAPMFVTPGKAITISLTNKNTEQAQVIPDRIRVSIYDPSAGYIDEREAANAAEITVPGTDGNENNILQGTGKVYYAELHAWKTGYTELYRNLMLITGTPSTDCTMTVNGSTEAAALQYGEMYTVKVSGLPEGVTAVGIMDPYDYGWSYQSGFSEPVTFVERTCSAYPVMDNHRIIAKFSTTAIVDGMNWEEDLDWTYTNAVTISVSCSHARTRTEYDWINVTATSNGAETHTKTGTAIPKVVCDSCGEVLETGEPAETSLTENHNYYNGVCTWCEYECQHEHTSHMEEIDWESGIAYEEITNDNLEHTIICTGLVYDLCDDCESVLNRQENQTIRSKERHSYLYDETTEEYVCDGCKHVCTHQYTESYYCDGCGRYCPHTFGEAQERVREGTFCEYRDDNDQHAVYSRIRETVQTCTVCGYEWVQNIQYLDLVGYADHDYSGGCCACGKDCPHTGAADAETYTRITEDAQWYPTDATHHVKAKLLLTLAICPDCGLETEISREFTEVEEGTEAACDFSEYGWCRECGNNCPHFWDNKDGVCTACGYECSHYFDEAGHCRTCGYQCGHVNLQTSEDSTTYEYEWVSAQQHRVRMIQTTYSYCGDCGLSEYRTTTGDYETENHFDYDTDGICDACLRPTQESNDWEVNGNTLVITGTGSIQDYSSGDVTPWAIYRNTVTKIILDSCITSIGDYAFAGFTNPVRIEFNQSQQPAISSTAFAGTDGAVCRYYTESTWEGGNFGGTNIKWIRLPGRSEGSLELKFSADGWQMLPTDMGSEWTTVTAEEIAELSFETGKAIQFCAIPTEEEDLAVIGNWDDVTHITMNCAGTLEIELTENSKLQFVTSCHSDGILTITDPRTDGLYEMSVYLGTVNYTGNIPLLYLKDSDHQTPAVNITGDVEELVFHGETTDAPYAGSLTVTGTVKNGYVWGNGTIYIPGVGNKTVNRMVVQSFKNAHQAEAIIENGELNVNNVTPVELSLGMYRPDYDYYRNEDGLVTILILYPKQEYYDVVGQSAIVCNDNGQFIPYDNIIWGEDSTILFQDTDGEVVLNGVTDENGKKIGISRVDIHGGTVTINCPVEVVNLSNYEETTEPVVLKIKDTVGLLQLEKTNNSTVIIGEGGRVEDGVWWRGFLSTRYFGPVTEEGTLFAGKSLRAMSWREGQQIRAELPTDEAVTAAAGLSGSLHATADVNDSSVAALDGEEKGALDDFMAEHEGAVAAIFDATITAYTEDAEGNVMPGGEITNLNSAVEFKVSNSTGEECYIVRLHEDENGIMTATQLTEEPSDAAVIPFSSNLFSKYAIIAKNWTEVEEWTEWTFGEVGEGIDKEWVLHISGSGEMPDYSSPAQAPWYAEAAEHENIRIVIDEGVTKVGSNAFGGLKGTVRADFRGTTMPTVSTTAFSGTTAKCRYYSENESWAAGISGRTDAQWTYLPRYEEDSPGRFPMNYGYPDTSATAPCWYLLDSNGNIPLTTEQAEELSYKCRVLDFDMMPTDTSLFATGNVPWQASFGAGCNGVQFALGATNGANTLERLNINAPGMTLTIDRRTAGEPMEFVEIKSGTVAITGDVTTLSLRNSNGETPCSVTITGDVGEMDFYNASTGGNAYSGDAEIIGTIHRGYEYGMTTMDIPGIGTNVPMENGMQVHAFEDLTRTETDGLIIDDGVLQLEGLAPESHTVSEYRLRYTFTDDEGTQFDATTLVLEPKEGGAETTVDILAYNKNFTENNIIWGEDTSVYIHWWDPSNPNEITLGGGTDAQGNRTGIYELFTNATVGTINLNCPVNQLEVYQRDSSTNALVLNINSKVEYEATLSLRGNGNTVRLGDFGWLAGGVKYMKPLTSTRVLPAIQGRHDPLIGDGRLTVLSHKTNERLESILPGDSYLTRAAGMPAVMEISESAEPLSGNELETLEGILTETATIAEVFDVTVTGYADGATEGATGTPIGELANDTVSMAVKNTTGGEAYVARLHEENGQMTATAVSAATTGDVVWFESNLFSKYVLIGNEPVGDIQYRIAGSRLILEGSGRMEDYATAADAPWYSERDEIKEIILGSGITKIGANAFGGFTDTVRVDFNQSTMPTIAETAFSGSNVICRYYTEDESWPTATSGYGATSIKWVYMPANNQGSDFEGIRYYRNNPTFGTGWTIYTQADGEFAVSREVAEEFSFLGREIWLYAMPEEQEDRDLYEAHWDLVRNIYFCMEDNGTETLTLPANISNLGISFNAPGWTMTIDASAADEGAFSMVSAGGGTLTITAPKINVLRLGEYTYGQPAATGNVTVNADVETLNYYNSANTSYAFAGNATIRGNISMGFEYGVKTAEIPNIPNLTAADAILCQFENVNQTTPVVENSQLNVANAEEFGTYTVNNSALYYQLYTNEDGSDWWRLQISPLAGGNAQPIHIEIADYNPEFTMDDIYWGEHTGLTLFQARPGETIQVEAPEGKGLISLSVTETNAVVMCPVNDLFVNDWNNANNPFQVTVNSPVNRCDIQLTYKTCNLALGQNGSIATGCLKRTLYNDLYFENLSSAGPVLQNGWLSVLSHQAGQTISTILPDETTLTTKAGLSDGQVAIMNVTDAGGLTPAEETAFETAQINGTADAAFDVTVTAYDGNGSSIGSVDTLSDEVTITVENVTGGNAYVVRLHDDGNGPVAEALTEPSDASVFVFESGLFSKYVLVKTEDQIDPSTLLTLKLPDSLTRIEEYAFAGGKFQAVIIPDGCTYIGDYAFQGCDQLVYISYPANYPEGIVIAEHAFDGCGEIKVVVRQGSVGR